jgi:hypothetical protein
VEPLIEGEDLWTKGWARSTRVKYRIGGRMAVSWHTRRGIGDEGVVVVLGAVELAEVEIRCRGIDVIENIILH